MLNQAIGYFKSNGTTFIGRGLALSADGKTLAMSIPADSSVAADPNDVSVSRSGAVRVFTKGPTGWVLQQFIKATVPLEDGLFGLSLALSADGNTLAVSSIQEDGSGKGLSAEDNDLSSQSGAVYLFKRYGSSWRSTRYIKAPNAEGADEFGASLALSGDGQTLAVFANGEDSAAAGIGGDQTDNTGAGTGAVYLY